MFDLQLIELPKLEQINREGYYRTYRTPEGNCYPSVTSVLSQGEDNAWYHEWVARVGQAEADAISTKATKRGSRIHKYCEDYLRDLPINYYNILDRIAFESILPAINRISTVYAIEAQLYSDKLRAAGTVDLIAKFDGEVSIVDWKTSKWSKRPSEITSYYLQCAAYAYMFYERTGITVVNIVIAMAVDNDYPLVYMESVVDWLPKFIEKRKSFTLIKK